jgi:hypothetical protein
MVVVRRKKVTGCDSALNARRFRHEIRKIIADLVI